MSTSRPVVPTASHAAAAPSAGASEESSKRGAPSSENRRGVATLKKFFEANPDEELTTAEAAAKIGTSHHTAMNYLAHLKGQGVLERVSVYRLKGEQ